LEQNLTWLKLTCTCSDPEQMSLWAVEYGAAGSEIIDDHSFVVFIVDQNKLPIIKEQLISQGVIIAKEESIKEENWVKNCQDVWSPVKVGKFNLFPVLEAEHAPINPGSMDILILPGNGFGTGHHESTQIALHILQHDVLCKSPPRSPPQSTLDVGTGNGILAFGAALLFQCPVLGIDNDILAINNATQNLSLNKKIESLVTLQHSEISATDSSYDLVLANIYSHTLCALKEDFKKRLNKNGFLLLSGIMKHQADEITSSYLYSDWEQVDRFEKNDWVGFLFKSRN